MPFCGHFVDDKHSDNDCRMLDPYSAKDALNMGVTVCTVSELAESFPRLHTQCRANAPTVAQK